MSTVSPHRSIALGPHRVPAPFRAFAVRSDEPAHAYDAREPYGRVHVVRPEGLDAATLDRLAACGRARMTVETFSDIAYAPTTLAELAAAAPCAGDPGTLIADGLRQTAVMGDGPAPYLATLATRVDFLGSCGAGFHNDVGGHWSRCLFWLLALAAADVEFVMPHAGLRLAVAPGDLLVFDPALAHGLCRPRDAGQAVAASFESGAHRQQWFLTGELPLADAEWAALGAPWLPVEVHERRGALDLMVAEFDERSGAIQSLRALRACMQRSTCHVGAWPRRT